MTSATSKNSTGRSPSTSGPTSRSPTTGWPTTGCSLATCTPIRRTEEGCGYSMPDKRENRIRDIISLLRNCRRLLNSSSNSHKMDGEIQETISMTPNEAKYLAAQIRKRRNELHLSAAEVARRAGVTTGTVTRLELAQISDPRPGNLVAIGQVLGLDP